MPWPAAGRHGTAADWLAGVAHGGDGAAAGGIARFQGPGDAASPTAAKFRRPARWLGSAYRHLRAAAAAPAGGVHAARVGRGAGRRARVCWFLPGDTRRLAAPAELSFPRGPADHGPALSTARAAAGGHGGGAFHSLFAGAGPAAAGPAGPGGPAAPARALRPGGTDHRLRRALPPAAGGGAPSGV